MVTVAEDRSPLYVSRCGQFEIKAHVVTPQALKKSVILTREIQKRAIEMLTPFSLPSSILLVDKLISGESPGSNAPINPWLAPERRSSQAGEAPLQQHEKLKELLKLNV
jgi:hypothetical protein